ncbi:hypothetical protein P8C59_009035 [Phyllachora maydis]|uniref:Protein yippee-like n=1 Tax=Phyllachora maydis TaxID=1825666 RepID=A0AAD9IDQ3_9PEZI|nr:hypothetical protein P8C59_009035 [Phyllachora maydis]
MAAAAAAAAALQHHTYLVGADKIYICKACNIHLAANEHLISRNFRANLGQGHLFAHVVNVRLGRPRERQMATGVHVVRDVYCAQCPDDNKIGWRYDRAADDRQQYKEGKYILEVQKTSKVRL